MTQNTSALSQWLVTEEDRLKAETKYQLRLLEDRFSKSVGFYNELQFFSEEAGLLSDALAHNYLDYLKLIDANNKMVCADLPAPAKILNWQKECLLIDHLKQQLAQADHHNEEVALVIEIAAHYYHLKKVSCLPATFFNHANYPQEHLEKLFKIDDWSAWLHAVVDFWNESKTQDLGLSAVFRQWNSQQQRAALDFFSAPELIRMVNTLFFFKLHPDQLFSKLIHSKKLISIRAKLKVLHQSIELLEQQLNGFALQQGLKPNVDYWFHGEALPDGIDFEIDESYKKIIQEVVKNLEIQPLSDDEVQEAMARLYSVHRAYKFWFNPHRLISTVMILKQQLVKKDIPVENNILAFHQAMLVLYHQLTTTECLALYDYFANKDSCNLLHALLVLDKGKSFEWLSELDSQGKAAITEVFHAVQCFVEALREALKMRHINTEPYSYLVENANFQADRCVQEAIFKVIEGYENEALVLHDSAEPVF